MFQDSWLTEMIAGSCIMVTFVSCSESWVDANLKINKIYMDDVNEFKELKWRAFLDVVKGEKKAWQKRKMQIIGSDGNRWFTLATSDGNR